MKQCTKCKQWHQLNLFGLDSKAPDKKCLHCKLCQKEYRTLFRQRNIEWLREYRRVNRDEINQKKREAFRRTDPKRRLWKSAQLRARRRNIEFDLLIEDIIIPEQCPLLKVKFEQGTKGDYPWSYSLDRINNSRGYTKDNVMVICSKANTMKNNASIAELIEFSKNILEFYKDDIVRTSGKPEELENKESLG